MDILKQTRSMTEEALVGKTSGGDLESFNLLILTCQDMSYNWARTRAVWQEHACASRKSCKAASITFKHIQGIEVVPKTPRLCLYTVC